MDSNLQQSHADAIKAIEYEITRLQLRVRSYKHIRPRQLNWGYIGDLRHILSGLEALKGGPPLSKTASSSGVLTRNRAILRGEDKDLEGI